MDIYIHVPQGSRDTIYRYIVRYFFSNHFGRTRNGPEKPTVAAITRQYRQLDLMLLCVVLENPIAVHAG